MLLEDILGEEFEREQTVQLGVFGFVDHTHATRAKQRKDLVKAIVARAMTQVFPGRSS
jgi:hypothetical protein